MSTVYFCNAEPIDLSAVAVMGVSVKVGDCPVGYFGTGLKFALSTLLRSGHRVALVRLGERVEFTAVAETIRGEEFQRVVMGGEKLGFTTQLGRNWRVWQAYRELRCNCTDEGGVVGEELAPGEWGTVFEVHGEEIAQCHRDRREIFVETAPLLATPDCEVHPGETLCAFYRGVRAHAHERRALFTYNVLDQTELTEDRTIKNGWEVGYYAERALAQTEDEDLAEQVLMADHGTFEHALSYSNAGKPSQVFMDTVFRLRHNVHCNQGAVKLWERHAAVRLTYEEVPLDAFDEEQVAAALVLVARLGAVVDKKDFTVVDGLGASVFGAVRGGRILIARAALDLGVRFVASTIYEEWLHKTEDLRDQTRELQNVLFEKLFAMTERCVAMERRQPAAATPEPVYSVAGPE